MKVFRWFIYCKQRHLFIYLLITLFKVSVHQRPLSLIKTNHNNENTNKNKKNFLLELLLAKRPFTVSYSQNAGL